MISSGKLATSLLFALTSLAALSCTRSESRAPISTNRGSGVVSPFTNAAERIAVRGGDFILASSGQAFAPRGVNYDRFAARSRHDGVPEWWFNTFDVGVYNAGEVEASMAGMQASNYNYVRVMLAGPALDNGFGRSSAGIDQSYLDNVADYLRRARNHQLRVVLAGFFEEGQYVPRNYLPLAQSVSAPNTSGGNLLVMHPGYATALGAFYQDLLRGLQAYPDNLLPTIFAIDIFNEASVNKHAAPFNQGSGNYSFAGQNYNLANSGERQALADAASIAWVNQVVASIRQVDAQVLVSASLFTIGATNNSGFNGVSLADGDDGTGRVALRPLAIAASSADYVDLHVYAYGNAYSFDADMQKEQLVAGQSLGKPILMGEVGAFKGANPTRESVVSLLQPLIARSCQYGFKGWGFWTWDNSGDKPNDAWSLSEQNGAINAFFAPSVNPNLCDAPVAPPPPPPPPVSHDRQSEGFFAISGTIFYSNGADAFCKITSWANYLAMGGQQDQSNVAPRTTLPGGMRNDGDCAPPAAPPPKTPEGFFKVNDGATGIFYSNGVDAYCAYDSWAAFLAAGGKQNQSNVRVLTSPPPASMRNDGICR